MGSQTYFTRVAYCEQCAKAGRPYYRDEFVVCGSTTSQFRIKDVYHCTKPGYTPHLFNLVKVEGNQILYRKNCAMHKCGITINGRSGERGRLIIHNSSIERMPLNQWNAMIRYKDRSYHLD